VKGNALARRLITVPTYLAAALLWLGAAPLWLPLAAVVYLVRRSPGVALRSGAFLGVYLACELAGMAACAGLWLWKACVGIEAERWLELHFRLEAWWGSTLLGAVVRIFGMRLEVEGDAGLGRGPYLLLLRHASSGDTLLPAALVSRAHGMHLRYVLKRELLWDPCLDIAGNRLPNVFIDRFSDDSSGEVRRIQELARNLGPTDGLLIYPEGTRATAARRARALDRFRRQGDTKMVEYVRGLECLLPPRPGGTLGLLDAAPEADIVFCAHTGFEGAASLAHIWQGGLVHRRVRVQFRRIPRGEVPTGRAARAAWLLDEWRAVDAWVASHRAD
jgi:hypothetical protein